MQWNGLPGSRVRLEANLRRNIGKSSLSFRSCTVMRKGTRCPPATGPSIIQLRMSRPLRENEAAVGFDLASDPTRAAAIRETSRTRVVTATAPVALVQDPGNHSGILLTLAVVDGSGGPGVLLFVMQMDKCVAAQLGTAGQMVAVQLVDRESNQNLVDGLASSFNTSSYNRSVLFGGRSYKVTTAPTKLYLAQHQNWQSWAVLVAGVLGTSLLGGS